MVATKQECCFWALPHDMVVYLSPFRICPAAGVCQKSAPFHQPFKYMATLLSHVRGSVVGNPLSMAAVSGAIVQMPELLPPFIFFKERKRIV